MLLLIYVILLIFTIIVLLFLFAAIDIFIDVIKEGPNIHHVLHVKWLFISHVLKDKERSGDESYEPNVAELDELDELDISRSNEDKGEKSSKFKWNVRESIAAFKMIIKPVVKLLEGILSCIDIHSFKCDLLFGFDDPANTGIAYGYIHALKGYLLHRCSKIELDVEPVFIEGRLDFIAVANIRIRIVNLIPVLFAFIFNRNVLRVSWAYLRNKGIPT